MNIFITGGTSGMGANLAKLYLKEGHRVGVCGRDENKFVEAKSTVFIDLAEHHLANLSFFKVDVSESLELKKAVDEFVGTKNLDLMIANAGIPTGKKDSYPDFEKAKIMIKINTLGVINAFEIGFNKMIQAKNGQLVAISSVAAFNGLPGVGPYSASKSAVKNLCESYALDWEQYGLSVTCICPGFVDTPFTKINNHKMPFLMGPDIAAELIKKAITRKKILFVFPWRMHIIVAILSFIPRGLYKKIMTFKTFNYSRKN